MRDTYEFEQGGLLFHIEEPPHLRHSVGQHWDHWGNSYEVVEFPGVFRVQAIERYSHELMKRNRIFSQTYDFFRHWRKERTKHGFWLLSWTEVRVYPDDAKDLESMKLAVRDLLAEYDARKKEGVFGGFAVVIDSRLPPETLIIGGIRVDNVNGTKDTK